ncbi:hypothetical protein [Laceyella sediminis]|uniref:hypothetical protein n=1 Tax=Laceyella sediminis TaxID=573074 RepID=UPI0011B2182C|nr:hypothetical protein [Laceyella sediminis]
MGLDRQIQRILGLCSGCHHRDRIVFRSALGRRNSGWCEQEEVKLKAVANEASASKELSRRVLGLLYHEGFQYSTGA